MAQKGYLDIVRRRRRRRRGVQEARSVANSGVCLVLKNEVESVVAGLS